MNRLGYRPEDYQQAIQRAKRITNIGSIVQMSHFANADSGAEYGDTKTDY